MCKFQQIGIAPKLYRNIFIFNVFFIVLVFSFLVNRGNAKVEPPNYNFSLDKLTLFTPGKKLQEIQSQYKSIEVMKEKGLKKVIRIYVTHLQYKFSVYVFLVNDSSQGYYAHLPSYFLHDTFHQSLINRIGKQDKYYLKDNHAVYVWENKNNLSYVYSGACTITCFPIYLAVMTQDIFLQLGKKKDGNLLLELESFMTDVTRQK